MKRGNMSKWVGDEMPSLQRKFLEEWLLHPEARVTKRQWCADNGVAERTTRHWTKDERFIKEWQKRLNEMHMSPEFTEDIIAELRNTALGGGAQSVRAAEVLLKFLGLMQPPSVNLQIDVESQVAELDDADLIEYVGELERA